MEFLKKNYWWLVPLALAGVAYWWLESEKKKAGGPGDEKGPRVDSVPPVSLDKSAKLYNGVQGKKEEVKFLQNWLNQNGASPKVAVDGIFGEKTAIALNQVKGVWDITLSKL